MTSGTKAKATKTTKPAERIASIARKFADERGDLLRAVDDLLLEAAESGRERTRVGNSPGLAGNHSPSPRPAPAADHTGRTRSSGLAGPGHWPRRECVKERGCRVGGSYH